MSGQVVAAKLVAANPGPAAHMALLGIVIAVALVIFGIVRWRNKRQAAEAEMRSTAHDNSPGSPPASEEQDRAPSRPDQ